MEMTSTELFDTADAHRGALHILAIVPEFCAALVSEALIGDLRCSKEIAQFCEEAIDKVAGSH